MTKRHASRRPGSHQNQLRTLRLILAPAGGGTGWAKLIAGKALARATAPETAAAPLSNPRRVTRLDDTLAMHVSFLAHLSRSAARLASVQRIVNTLCLECPVPRPYAVLQPRVVYID